ncbi:nuclear transport factor 2 family protein [Paracoccus alkenifer]|uniref:SnoaL-like domain-containing protein n=1 Tax=Paracoccus alkenifer TaxID=65735 RepID=A0A1H6MN00_9RHOB|nr:nuclear transport factor 2 family protein [Paracoccus alkenifer]SEH99909.1 SnoaL-like domain-containing protein [Paracoccus alkenifer]
MTQPTDAVAICEAFLIAMEKRDLDLARSFVAADALEMVFPGGARFDSIDAMVAGAATRYRFVGKHFDRRDSWTTPEGESVLIAGRLYGEWLDGSTFEDIRFVDLFDLRDGKIWRQHVWNDMGEYKLKALSAQG